MRFLLIMASITVSIPLAFAEEITTSSNKSAPEPQSSLTETITPATTLPTPTKPDSKSLEHFLQQNLTQIESLMTQMLSHVEKMHEMVQQLTTAIQPRLTTPPPSTSISMPAKSPLQLHHQQMRRQMKQIQQTQDPIERNKLLQQHLQQMNAFQQVIADTTANKSLNPPSSLMRNRDLINTRMDKLEKRLNGMYTLLEQILAHQQASQSHP